MDSVCLALFARMAELHKSVCLLVGNGMRRDAVILARTMCEAAISVYWLTNSQTEDRFDRYVTFGGQIYAQFIERFHKYLGYVHTPSDPTEVRVIASAEKLFRDKEYRWNEKSIWEMANEPDLYESKPGARVSLAPQSGLHYFWFSLHAHPTIWAVQSFLPKPGQPFKSSLPHRRFRDVPERRVVFLSTVWLFLMTLRIDTALRLRRGPELRNIWDSIRS